MNHGFYGWRYFSSINDENVPELTRVRSMGSVPYGGRYRLIDFALSNMVNSGITTVGVITKQNYQSLMDHLGTGKDWDLARKEGGLILLPPYSDESETLYKGRLEALKGATSFLKSANRTMSSFPTAIPFINSITATL